MQTSLGAEVWATTEEGTCGCMFFSHGPGQACACVLALRPCSGVIICPVPIMTIMRSNKESSHGDDSSGSII